MTSFSRLFSCASAAALLAFAVVSVRPVRADILDLETFSGSSSFGGAAQTLTINGTSAGTVTISGGTVLTNESNLPADETTVYGTAYFGGGLSNTITLTFTSPISNFFVDVYNGETYPDPFTISDNVGDTVTQIIAPNLSSGLALISFPAAGTMVTITTSDPSWDFSIDNIGFNQSTPGTTPVGTVTPEPSSFALLGTGVLGAAGAMRRRWLAA